MASDVAQSTFSWVAITQVPSAGFPILSPSHRRFIQSTATSPQSTLLAGLHASVTWLLRRRRALPPGTIRVHSIDTGILTASTPLEMPLNSDWNCTLTLLTRARAASTSFLQLPPNPAPATQASVRALHENVRINTLALRRLLRCAPRPPPASSSKHPFLILTSPFSSSHVPTVNSHASSPLPPLPCDNSSRSSTSNSPISCPMRPFYT